MADPAANMFLLLLLYLLGIKYIHACHFSHKPDLLGLNKNFVRLAYGG